MPDLPLEISCADVHALRDAGAELLLVDCREPDEFAICTIGAATPLPMSEIQRDGVGSLLRLANESTLQTLQSQKTPDPLSRPVVVYCHLGGRSARVAAWLREQGFPQAQSMAGGIDQWAAEIEPGMPRY